MRESVIRKSAQVILITVFQLAIWLPLLASWSGYDPYPQLVENRRFARRPALSASPRKFEKYYADNFGLRNPLIRLHNYVKVKWLGVSPNGKVMIGKGDWLYLGLASAVSSYRATNPFSMQELKQWQATLEARCAWLAQQGIFYLFVIPPNKHTIYPEHLPDPITRVGPDTRLDQLVAHMQRFSRFQILDVRPALFAAKKRVRVFQRTDSHWNDMGAYTAYAEVMMQLSKSDPRLRPAPLTEFRINTTTAQAGVALSRLLGVPGLYPRDGIQLDPVTPPTNRTFRARERADDRKRRKHTVSERSGAGLPRAVMFRDSFASHMIKFISPHFSRIIYVWQQNFDPKLIRHERPQVVIHEMVERNLMRKAPGNPEEVAAARNSPAGAERCAAK